MPREIRYCPQCGSLNIEKLNDEYVRCYECKTHLNKMDLKGWTLYTESELQERIQQEREECALICEEERDRDNEYVFLSAERCAEAIRKRGEG